MNLFELSFGKDFELMHSLYPFYIISKALLPIYIQVKLKTGIAGSVKKNNYAGNLTSNITCYI